MIFAAILSARLVPLNWLDTTVIVLYFVAVLGVGFLLRSETNTSEDFFLAGREMSAWIAGISFLAANMGALELMGWAASAYQYGLLAAHWYWIGAVPAMLFLALVMMPFYYISRTHSVPGYLKLRFGEPTRALSAISFAGMTILMSGINMFAMAKVMQVVPGWNLDFSIIVSSLAVAVYVTLGGLRSAILNEVLQFFLIWAGALVVPILGLVETGGWSGLKARIVENTNSDGYLHLWTTLGHFKSNSMGVSWGGGFVVRYTPEGCELGRFVVPAPRVTSLTFGGDDLRTLFITTAGGDTHDTDGPLAGDLFAMEPGVKGVPEFRSRICCNNPEENTC